MAWKLAVRNFQVHIMHCLDGLLAGCVAITASASPPISSCLKLSHYRACRPERLHMSALIIITLVSLYGATASKWLRLWPTLTNGSSSVNLSVSQAVTACWLMPADLLPSLFQLRGLFPPRLLHLPAFSAPCS